MTITKRITVGFAVLTTAIILTACSKKEDVVESVQLEGGKYPANDTLGMWESITKNNCTDKAKDKHKDGKNFELLSFTTNPNPPRKSEDGRFNLYDSVSCEVKVSF